MGWDIKFEADDLGVVFGMMLIGTLVCIIALAVEKGQEIRRRRRGVEASAAKKKAE